MNDDTQQPWPTNALTSVGFHPRDAQRLAKVLPPLDTRVLAHLDAEARTWWRYFQRNEPAAFVVSILLYTTTERAICLTRAGRGLLDVLAIIDATEEHFPYLPSIKRFNVAMDWAMERRVPRHRIAYYIALGFPPEVATIWERDPDSRPSDTTLQTLSALRRP